VCVTTPIGNMSGACMLRCATNAGSRARGCAPCYRANGNARTVAVGQSYRMDFLTKT
jgi:hypothetical protein